VNYPIKQALNELQDAEEINMQLPHHMHAVSSVARMVASFGAKIAVTSWNNHSVPGKVN